MMSRRAALGLGAATIALGAAGAASAQYRGPRWERLSERRIVRVALLSHHDLFVAAEPDGAAVANRGALGAWETWTLVRHSGGGVSFLGAHGMYLVAEPDGRANANRTALGPWEIFRPVSQGRRTAFLGAHGRFLAAERDGRLRADRRQLGPRTFFRVAPA